MVCLKIRFIRMQKLIFSLKNSFLTHQLPKLYCKTLTLCFNLPITCKRLLYMSCRRRLFYERRRFKCKKIRFIRMQKLVFGLKNSFLTHRLPKLYCKTLTLCFNLPITRRRLLYMSCRSRLFCERRKMVCLKIRFLCKGKLVLNL